MKPFTTIILFLAFCSAAVADFKAGARVRLTREAPLYFSDSVYRQGTAGEEFVVHTHNSQTGKVFVIITDNAGKQKALNIQQEALAPMPSSPPAGAAPAMAGSRGVEGILGIPWGATRDQVTQTMLEREGVKLDGSSKGDYLIFDGGRFAGMSGVSYMFCFYDEKLCKGSILLNADDRHPVSDYNSVRDLLVEKYGKPHANFSFYSSPYHDGDGYEAQAIRAGKGNFSDYWSFPTKDAPKSKLSSRLTPSLIIVISYKDSATATKFDEKNKEKRKSDL